MARRLLLGAGLGVTPESVRAVIESAFATEEGARNPDPAESFCAFCLCAFERKPMREDEDAEFLAVARYWLDERPKRRRP